MHKHITYLCTFSFTYVYGPQQIAKREHFEKGEKVKTKK